MTKEKTSKGQKMLTVDLKAFREVVGKAAVAVSPKSPKPILAYLLIQADGDSFSVRATDLEISVQVFGKCDTTAALAVAIRADRLRACLQESQGEQLYLEVSGDKAIVRTERQRWSLQTMPADEFPVHKKVTGHEWKAASQAIRAALRTRKACDPGAARYALGGVAFCGCKGIRYAAATDTHWVCWQELGETDDQRVLILPLKAANLLSSMLDGSGEVIVTDDTRSMGFEADGLSFSAILLEGRFPDWSNHRPASYEAEIEVNRDAMISLTRSASVTTSEESSGVDFSLGDGDLTASSTAKEIGESKSSLPVSYSGKKIDVTLSPRFVLPFLMECERGEVVSLSLIDAHKPARFSTADGFGCLVMPISKER
jgi:DNA polymerase III subunit beta